MHGDLRQVILVGVLEGLDAQRVLGQAPALFLAGAAVDEAVEAPGDARIAVGGGDGEIALSIIVNIPSGDEDAPQAPGHVP